MIASANVGSRVISANACLMVWTGRATKTLDPSKNQQKNLNNLNKAIAKLLKNYPPPMN